MSRNEFLWVEKYRPKNIDECILPEDTKKTFKEFLTSEQIPNLLLHGTAGIGKTTVARALCEELGVDYIIVNGSDEGRALDTVRNKVKNFASTLSLSSNSKHKVVIIDEADNTTHDVQLALRANIETFSGNCRFIFTCNYKNKIIEPLHSRCAVIDFSIPGKQKRLLAGTFFDRLRTILTEEGVQFDEKVLPQIILKFFPDWRRILNECQRYAIGGVIDSGILASMSDVKFAELIDSLKNKQYTTVKKWVSGNLDNEPSHIFRSIYDNLYQYLEPQTIPHAVLIIGKYQYQSAFVADQEINLLAALTEMMVECQFK
jgi:DNA polymerase III delta prime subunit